MLFALLLVNMRVRMQERTGISVVQQELEQQSRKNPLLWGTDITKTL